MFNQSTFIFSAKLAVITVCVFSLFLPVSRRSNDDARTADHLSAKIENIKVNLPDRIRSSKKHSAAIAGLFAIPPIPNSSINGASNNSFKSSNSPDDPAHPENIVGVWKIESNQSGGLFSQLLSNQYLEFHTVGIGISKNDALNTTKNVRVFLWYVSGDILHFVFIRDAKYTLMSDCLFSITNGVLSFKCVKQTETTVSGSKVLEPPAILQASIRKISDNQLAKYINYLPAQKAKGNWIQETRVRNGVQTNFRDRYYDIHPSTDHIGELFSYDASNLSANMPMDSIFFLKYTYKSNIAMNMLKQINPGGGGLLQDILSMADKSDDFSNPFYPNKSTDPMFVFNGLNIDSRENISCYYSDGIIVMVQGNAMFYLIKTGSCRWPDGVLLHNQYNRYRGKEILPPFGTHWQVCPACNGEGKLIFDSEESKYYKEGEIRGVTVNEYAGRYTHQTCSTCSGAGGKYVSDKNDEAQATASDSPPAPAANLAFFRIKNLKNNAYINNQTGIATASDIKDGWWSAQWQIIDVPGTNYVNIKNKWTGAYLTGLSSSNSIKLAELNLYDGTRWVIERIAGKDAFKIKNILSGAYLSIDGGRLKLSFNDKNGAEWVLENL